MVYLGGNEQSTHKYISELLGKWTIDKRASGETLGRNGSSSRNYDVLGRELMTPDEVRKLDNRECMVFIRGQDPVKDLKYQTFEKKEFKESRKLGPYRHTPAGTESGDDNMNHVEPDITIYNEKALEYFEEKAKDHENVAIWHMTEEEIMNLNPDDFEETDSISQEEIAMLIEENRMAIQNSLEREEAIKKELIELEESKKLLQDSETESLAERLLNAEFTAEQKKQAEIGMRNGLTEELVLAYFRPDVPAEDMAVLRVLAEQTLIHKA